MNSPSRTFATLGFTAFALSTLSLATLWDSRQNPDSSVRAFRPKTGEWLVMMGVDYRFSSGALYAAVDDEVAVRRIEPQIRACRLLNARLGLGFEATILPAFSGKERPGSSALAFSVGPSLVLLAASTATDIQPFASAGMAVTFARLVLETYWTDMGWSAGLRGGLVFPVGNTLGLSAELGFHHEVLGLGTDAFFGGLASGGNSMVIGLRLAAHTSAGGTR